MRRLTFENNRGETIIFYLSPLLIEALTGIAETDIVNQDQQAPYQDGTTHVDTTLQPRYPTLEGVITDTNLMNIKQYRKEILRVCNPKLGLGKVILELDGDTKQIDGVIDSMNFPDRGNNPFQRFMITWKCPNPYWQDVDPTNIKLEDYVANFSFPFSFPVTFSIRGDSRTLVNDGHVPTPIKVTFVGNAVNPKITKVETGEFIKINRTIPEGYSLIITTESDNKSVKIVSPNGDTTNAIGYIDLGTTFFSLDVGNNELEFITDGGQPEVYVEYRNWYVGI